MKISCISVAFHAFFLLGFFPIQAQRLAHAAEALPEAPNAQQTPERVATALLSSSSVASATALQAESSSAQQVPAQSAPPVSQSSSEGVKQEEKQRMLGVVPAFNAVESGTAAPLTPSQKFDLWYRASLDPFTFVTAGFTAGIEQAQDSYPGYQQGAEGYAKRYGAAYADGVDGNLWGNAILPIMLHQDPRYFRLGHGTVKQRVWYAALSTVRTRGDNGKWQPNYSNVAGNLIGGGISNLYYPSSDRGIGLTFERGFTVTAEGAFGSLAYEFYPDVAKWWTRRRAQRNVHIAPPVSATSQIRPAAHP